MKKISVFVLFTILILISCDSDSTDQNLSEPKQITFPGVGDHGIFDPSLAKDPAESRIWMSYSEVDQSPGSLANKAINTRLAYSDNFGADWNDSGTIVNQSSDIALPFAPPNDIGTWEYEVSSICYDPEALAAERWKLMFHRYLCMNGSRLFQHGWIGMKTASAPDGTWSNERKLFVGSLYDPSDDSIIGAPEVDSLNTLHAELSSCLAFSEPGLLATDDALYCAMLGAEGSSTNGRIILLKYAHPVGPWEYLRTLILNSTDGPSLGYDGFSAPSMFRKGNKYYLMATPQIADKYLGTFVFEITDLDTATLKRDGGVLVVEKRIFGRAGSHNGAAGYIPEANACGIIYSDVMPAAPLDFRIYASFINL
jgi:hypothetical protein